MSESPRQETDVGTPLSFERKGEALEGNPESSIEKVFQALDTFLAEKGAQSTGLSLGDNKISPQQLWQSVVQAGGYEAVTANKSWAAVGRQFNPPKNMTDLSHRVKKAYECHLLPFERALRKGEISGVKMPPELESGSVATASKAAGIDRTAQKAVKREGGSRAAGQSAAKRAKGGSPGVKQGGRGSARSVTGGMGLINARVLIKFDDEHAAERAVFYIGTVASFSKDKHHVIFDDGDEDDIDLSEEVWRLATQKDEEEAAQNYGKVPVKDSDTAPGKASGAHDVASQDTLKWPSPDTGMAADKKLEAATSQPSMTDAPELSREVEPDVVVRGPQFKVREGVCDGQPCYEIYVMVGPVNKEDVKVKCWPEGKVRVMGTPHPGIEKWTKDKIEHNIQLPSPIDPYSAKALITLHGLLYISVQRIS